MEKRRQKKRILLQSQKVAHFFGTVFYIKKHQDNKKTKKKSFK